MYLLIGHDRDPCCRIVQTMLHERGHSVCLTADPLVNEHVFSWNLETTRSASNLRHANESAADHVLQGVLVRAQGGPLDSANWDRVDFAYMQAEAHAALVAWLRDLPCPVVSRPTADLWFRSLRPFPEWRALFLQCGLPTLAACVTNDLAAAQRFASAWDGAAIYAPLTSSTRYPVVDAEQWRELAKVLEHIPACLIEPCSGPRSYVTIVGRHVVWSCLPDSTASRRAVLEQALYKLAAALQQTVLQVELQLDSAGPRCIGVQMYPLFEAYDSAEQAAIALGMVELLEGA